MQYKPKLIYLNLSFFIMRKALLLLAAIMLLPVAMSAQVLDNGELKMQKAPFAFKNYTTKMMAPGRMVPARADLADNQMIMGHYDTDDVATSEDGLGITSLTGTRRLGTILTPSEMEVFQGGKIVKFRVGLANATTISTVFVAPVSSTGAVGTLKTWSCNASAAGWNEIELATPYDLNLDPDQSLMIGFDYRQTNSNYPISAVDVGTIYTTYLYYQNSWQDVGLSSYGNLSVQCVVENDNFPEYMISVGDLYTPNYTKLGEDIFVLFATRNSGVVNNIPAGSCTYDIYIDGKFAATMTNDRDLTRTYEDYDISIPSEGMASGKHTVTVVASELFGEPIENPVSVSRDFFLYVNSFDRQMHLIEEFTSNSCTYCPLGATMLNLLMGMRDDIAMVAIHGNQSSVDPCNTSECDDLFNYMGAGGWPYAAFDRSVGWEDDETIATGIGYDTQYHQMAAEAISGFLDVLAEETPSFATVHINSTLDPDTREAVVTVDGDLTSDFDQMMGEDAKLSVFLTEDSLVYRQLNLGTWVSKYVHNHVYRKALGSVFGVEINKVDGDKYSNTFEITIPSGWNTDKIEVVAFISRPLANGATGVYTDMYVNQTNKRKLGEFDEPVGLRGDVDGDGDVNIADVTALIDYLLSGDAAGVNLDAADCDKDGDVNIADVTSLIDYLLSGEWTE